jgi:hypothetical protein
VGSLDRPREVMNEQLVEPDGAALLAGLAEALRAQKFSTEFVGERLRVSAGPEGRSVELVCRRRPSDGDRWWFSLARDIWLCEADRPVDATVQVKGALRRGRG